MKYYLKKATIGFVYLLFSAVTGYGVLYIEGLVWLKITLLILNLCLYSYVLASTAFQDGQAAYKVRIANDLNRKQIILTGEDLPVDTKQEYKPYKGMIIGLIICLPLIVCMTIHSIIMASGVKNYDFGIISGFLYFGVYAFACINFKVEQAFSMVSPYWALLAIPVVVLVEGIFFYLGGRKIELQQEMIKEKHRMIHGE